MARSKITSSSKDLITDDGAVLISVIDGEQIHLNLTLSWLTNISDYTIFATVTEGANDGLGNKPTNYQTNGITTSLPILDNTDTDNSLLLVIPQTLGKNWSVRPSPDKPVYGFIDLEVQDTGVGERKQIWKPFRGLIEIRYSPTETGV